ncbi:MAG: PfaB family protein [Nostocales cyanobacterium 94392]|nr:PfaB family protein [Nostocales cyanobacterium 94392]
MLNTSNQNHKIAITGININSNSSKELDDFERHIYEGKQYNIPSQNNLEIIKIAKNTLKNAQIDTKNKIAVIITPDQNISQTELSNLPFTHTATSTTVFSAIKMAQKLLIIREVDTVLIISHTVALVLKLYADAQKKHQPIYATIDALTISQNTSPTPQKITQTCQQSFNIAGVKPEDIGYLEICSNSIFSPNELEIKGLVAAYQNPEKLIQFNCAVGSVKDNIDNSSISEIESVIKTVLCLYYRYIPSTSQWSSPKYPEFWENSPFYVDNQSKPWFLSTQTSKRIAAINSFNNDNVAHLILSEAPSQQRDSRYLSQMPYYLFPLAADESSNLLEQIQQLERTISQSDSLSIIAAQTYRYYQQHQNATYAIAIIGRNHKELQREIQNALKGVKNAFETGEEWKTPVGSYFTAKPLGKKGKVAFVYPGAYSSYIGIARNLFRLFPKIWDSPVIENLYNRVANIEKLLYPRSLTALTKRQLEVVEQQLIDNPLSMLESEVGFAALMSAILEDYFRVQPQSCFGYSLGEVSMAIAQGIWTGFNQTSSSLNSSELFTSRLSGCKNAVREYWGLTNEEIKGEFWGNYVLMADVSQVKEQLKKEPRVYLTQINTAQEMVIAGETAACQRVIKTIGCNAIPAPFNHVIHCEAMASEYDELVKLHTLPIHNRPEIDFYSASNYGQLNLDSEVMSHSIAKVLCQQFDFPQLVNRVYDSGARIFVEVGAGNACSRWISENLQQREHTTIFFNRRGVPEHTSLVRGLAQLFSHRVSISLSALYEQQQLEKIHLQTAETVTPTTHKEVKNKIAFNKIQNQHQQVMVTLSSRYWGKFTMEEWYTSVNFNGRNTQILNLPDYQDNTTKIFAQTVNQQSIDKEINPGLGNDKLSKFLQSHSRKITEANQQNSQAHLAFLKNRQSSFAQMVKMVELQLTVDS